jgi:hypothetical protein
LIGWMRQRRALPGFISSNQVRSQYKNRSPGNGFAMDTAIAHFGLYAVRASSGPSSLLLQHVELID